jgi:hypothetical protein
VAWTSTAARVSACAAGVDGIKVQRPCHYRQVEDYNHCDGWLPLDMDLTASMGKPKRINVGLPDGLIQRIDTRVKSPVLASFSDFGSQAYALQHCSTAALQHCSPAALQPCSLSV